MFSAPQCCYDNYRIHHYRVGNKCYSAVRLDNGNTLIGGGNGHCVLEVTPNKEIVWSIFQHDLPGIVLAWVTQVKRKPNGNTQIVNCHAGPDNPHIVEVNSAKEVVWTWCDIFHDRQVYGIVVLAHLKICPIATSS